MRQHPSRLESPFQDFVFCATCSKPMHEKALTCGNYCPVAGVWPLVSLDLDPMSRLLAAGYREQAPL